MKKSAVFFLHLGYWSSYLFLLFVLSVFVHGRFVFQGASLLVFILLFAIIPAALSFYSFYTFLFTKFLKQRKVLSLLMGGIVTAAIYGCLGWILLYMAWNHIGPVRKVRINYGGAEETMALMIITSVNALLNGVIGLVMRGFINWYTDIKLKEELNKRNYEMEMALLKAQIAPHFLFNTINNIDVLIEKNNKQASVYLNKLSDILRFMLYETKTETVALTKELVYIEKYIDLQKIRNVQSDYIQYTVEGDAAGKMIAPMLFIPFIENAFKHAENKKEANTINIQIRIDKDALHFICRNKYSKMTSLRPYHSGLGNELIQKRLSLLYPGRHMLNTVDKNDVYTVTLMLKNYEN